MIQISKLEADKRVLEEDQFLSVSKLQKRLVPWSFSLTEQEQACSGIGTGTQDSRQIRICYRAGSELLGRFFVTQEGKLTQGLCPPHPPLFTNSLGLNTKAQSDHAVAVENTVGAGE